MGRKNGNVRQSNTRGRYRQPDFPMPKMQTQQPRVRVEDLVMPDGQCRFQTPRKPKARFATEEKAAKALAQAQRQRARMGSTHVEKRYYPCPEGGCGGYHLSSREEFDEKIWRQRRSQYEQKYGLS